MALHKFKLAIILLLVFIAGCTEKDELTRPVKVTLNVGFSTSGDWDPFDQYFYFTEGHIGIQRILFDGKREAGEDVFFETDPNISLSTLEFRLLPTIISVFALPQGIYNYMKWDIYLRKIVTDELIDGDDSGLQNIGLVIKGYYDDWIWDEESDSIPFIFALDYTDQFSVRSCDVYNNSRIILSENKDYEAILSLDLFSAFHSLSLNSFQEAEISGDSEHPLILISSSKNKNLYEILSYRIVQYAKVVVK